MKATLILDSLGPNPDFAPPQRNDFATEDEFHDADALYDVPPDILIPAGTEISGPYVHAHCHPDGSGIRLVNNPKTGKKEPRSLKPGIVRAVPADAACEAQLAKWVQAQAIQRRVKPSAVLKEITDGVAASRAEQTRRDQEKAAEAQAESEAPATSESSVVTAGPTTP